MEWLWWLLIGAVSVVAALALMIGAYWLMMATGHMRGPRVR